MAGVAQGDRAGVTRVAVLRDPRRWLLGSASSASSRPWRRRFAVEPTRSIVRDTGEIERTVESVRAESNGGLFVTASPLIELHRDLIVTLAAQHKLPAIYSERSFAADGGLISYGPISSNQFRRAAGYVDRILKGEKPADLPVQAPTKYELVINLKTAKALGLTVPPTLLARADEVIE